MRSSKNENNIKTLLWLLSILFLCVYVAGHLLSHVTVIHAAELRVSIENPPPEGTLVFLLFNSADAFGDFRDPIKTLRFPSDGRDAYQISDIPSGEYAMLVYYDENGNGRLDKNFIGIPKEPLAFSNRYRPKGPPSYSRARFQLEEGEALTFDVRLFHSLGKLGRFGVGVCVIGRSSPYRDSDEGVFQPIPMFTYNGERLQLLGPSLRFGLVGSGDLRLAVAVRYRMGVYEEDESPVLSGLGDRKNTLMAGLALIYELPGGVGLKVGYNHDILDQIGGGAAQVGVNKSLHWGAVRILLNTGLNWLSSGLSNHDFGVPENNATENRPVYSLKNSFNIEAGIAGFLELTRDWRAFLNMSVEFLDDEIADSPIVSEKYVMKGFAAFNYVF